MSGILPSVRQPKKFGDPDFTSIPSISAQRSLPSLASLFWLLYKIKFQTGICIQSLHGRVEVRNLNGYRPSSEDQRYVMNVNVRLICIFWVPAFPTEKSQILSVFFDLRKSPVR